MLHMGLEYGGRASEYFYWEVTRRDSVGSCILERKAIDHRVMFQGPTCIHFLIHSQNLVMEHVM